MIKRIIALSGPIAVGKTTLAEMLASVGFGVFSTGRYLRDQAGGVGARQLLLQTGDDLSRKTKHLWIHEAIEHIELPVVVDSLRCQEDARVNWTHIHLTASESVLRQRYATRGQSQSYDDAVKSSGDLKALENGATFVIDTDHLKPEDVFSVVRQIIAPLPERTVDVLIGGQYGSEGKGQIAAHLAGSYDLLVRSGGPNAGHWVRSSEVEYCYHHLPSGTQTNRDATIAIAAGAAIWLPRFLQEVAECKPSRLVIDPCAVLIDDYDRAFEGCGLATDAPENCMVTQIGSTGQGVGSAAARRILRKAAKPPVRIAFEEPALQQYLGSVSDLIGRSERVFLEGTQGSGLSMYHGPYPFTTSRDTNVSGLLAECGVPPSRVRRVVMVCRSYPIRTGGNSGPLREITWNDVVNRADLDSREVMRNELTSTTKRIRRVGEFDWELFRRACYLNRPTDIALTFLDYIDGKNRLAFDHQKLTPRTQRFIELVEQAGRSHVSLVSTGPSAKHVLERHFFHY